MSDTTWIDTQQLRVGLYVHLDLSWLEHPFAFSHFKIVSEDQIATIRGLGLGRVRYSPERSDEAVALAVSARPSAAPPLAEDVRCADEPKASPVMQAKQALMAQIRQRRETAERIERAFVATAHTIRDNERIIYSQPDVALANTTQLVARIADSILTAPDMVIQVMGEKPGGEEIYLHSLNVATLAMMVARELRLPKELVATLGVGALLHDIGKHEVPDRILKKAGPQSAAERHFFEQHPAYGAAMAQRMHLPAAGLAIIAQHHEFHDGSGYPDGLRGEAVGLLSRIVVIGNHFDGLCNPPQMEDALTPHEALSLMFARLQAKFDPQLLKVFIHCMGVYPPGSIVQLSNGAVGMVLSVNTQRPLKPVVMVYDASVPREEAILLDMDTERSLNIGKALRPAQVPREVLSYLSPRMHLSYYFDASTAQPRRGQP
jgi:putative nucleotidyltransferase with HDIG domain